MEKTKVIKRKKSWKSVLKKNLLGWAFMIVPLILFAFFVWYPMGRNIVLAFQKSYDDPTFVGFSNFVSIFQDPSFLSALKNTFLYILWSIVIGYFVPVLLGFLLSEVVHLKGVFRVILYLPCMISGMAVVFLFSNMYSDSATGLFNVISAHMGWGTHPWKGSVDLIIPLIVLAMTWKGAGSTSLIYLSAFQSIDDSMYEAARIDGASAGQRFWRITIPALRGTLLTLFVLQIISVFQVFYEPLVIGPKGGPLDSSMSLMLLSYLYAFEDLEYGKSAACALVLGSIIIVFTVLYSILDRYLKKKEGK